MGESGNFVLPILFYFRCSELLVLPSLVGVEKLERSDGEIFLFGRVEMAAPRIGRSDEKGGLQPDKQSRMRPGRKKKQNAGKGIIKI